MQSTGPLLKIDLAGGQVSLRYCENKTTVAGGQVSLRHCKNKTAVAGGQASLSIGKTN